MTQSQGGSRRHDLDWLRVIVFGILIFYHIGMFYTSWGFHVKSVHATSAVEPYMKLINPWRLPLLFLISGIALRFAFDKKTATALAISRFIILFVPLFFCIHTVIAPQAWLELLQKGEISSGFWSFFPEYIKGSYDKYSIVIPTWNHLWYVVYILVYTLCLLPFARYLVALQEWCRTLFSEKFESHKLTHILLLSLPVTSFLLFVFILKPQFASTHALINDWANHQLYFSLFLLGFIVAKSERFWQVIAKALPFTLLFVITSVLLASLVWYLEAINYWTPTFDVIERYSERNRKTFYAWYMMITLLAVAQRWLNKPSSLLTYANEAVFPFYILHQTLIVMFGYWLTRQGLSMGAEFISLALLTILGCMVIYEFGIRRWNVVRPLFGVKLIKYNSLKKATS